MPFWSKDEQTRIDETVNFIVGKLPPAEQANARAWLNTFITANYGTPAGRKILSDAMSTKPANQAGDKETRAARRALVIVRGDMINSAHPKRMNAPQIMAMPSGQVISAFAEMLPLFRVFVAQEQGNVALLQQYYDDFKAIPQVFLKKHIIITQSTPGVGGVGSVQNHNFYLDYKNQAFSMSPPGLTRPPYIVGAGLTIPCVNVPEIVWANVPGKGPVPTQGSFANIPGTRLNGADMMVTSAFSGCSFVFKRNGAGTFAAHIGPDGTLSNAGVGSIGPAPTLVNQLMATGNFGTPVLARTGALNVFGRGRSSLPAFPNGYAVNPMPGMSLILNSMFIFGICKSGMWSFYCQENQNGASTVQKIFG